MLWGRAADTRAKRCAYRQGAPNPATDVAKTGGVRVCRGSADRTGLGQDSSTSTARGRGGFAPAVSATVRATRGGAAAAMRRACPDLWEVLRETLGKVGPYVLRHDLQSAPFGLRLGRRVSGAHPLRALIENASVDRAARCCGRSWRMVRARPPQSPGSSPVRLPGCR